MKIRLGPAGIPTVATKRSTVEGIKTVAQLGLNAMEVEFVRGVAMSLEGAAEAGQVASQLDVRLSVHAPYFINLNAHEPEKIRASQGRLLQAARIGSICGAESIVFHTAFYLGDPPEQAYSAIKQHLKEVLNQLKRENNRVWIRPEVMGKLSEFGTLTEILSLCTELEGLAPCLDFAHWHARTGAFNSYPEFTSILLQTKERLGRAALDNIHIHVSGIAYGKKGEVKHLNLKESDFQYVEFLKALKDHDVKGLVICESPNLEEDAQLLQATYNTLLKTE